MSGTSRRRILCAESNSDVGELLARMLEMRGYEVAAVQTAAECLTLARRGDFDLYLLNDTYIDADSVELCRRLRALDPAVPVLLFSLDSSGYGHRLTRDGRAPVYRSQTSDFVALVQTIDRLMRPAEATPGGVH